MATYALTVSTDALGIGVINGARVIAEKKRTVISDVFPSSSLYKKTAATNELGVAVLLLEPDDGSVYHEIKVFDLSGIPVFTKIITMPPQAIALSALPIQDIISESAAQAVSSAVSAATSAETAATQANNASNSASAAATSAVLSTDAKVAAEEARDAAQLTAVMYATSAAGISATTNGQYFSVPVVGTNDYLILYKNNAGVALEINRYPSTAAVKKPLWVGKNNAYPDPFFRKITLTTKTLLGAERWWSNSVPSPFAGWSLVANTVFDGFALRRTASYGTTTNSGPTIILSDIGAVAGDTITIYGLFIGSGAVVSFPARFDAGTDVSPVGSQVSPVDITGALTYVIASSTPQWLRHSLVVPAGATRLSLYPYTSTSGQTFDWIALWGGKGGVGYVPDYPIYGSDEALFLTGKTLQAQITSNDRTLVTDYALFSKGSVTYSAAVTNLTAQTVLFNAAYSNPFTGWGERFTPAGISFNAVKIKSLSRNVATTTVKWRKINVVIRTGTNSHLTGATVVAVGEILVNSKADTLSDVIILLKDPITGATKTLTNADFSGGEYFVGIYATDEMGIAAGMSIPRATLSNTLSQSYYLTTANAKTATWETYSSNLRTGVEHLLLTSPVDSVTVVLPTDDFVKAVLAPDTAMIIATPPTLYLLQNTEISLYFDNIFYERAENYLIDVTGATTGSQQAERYKTNPTGAITLHDVTINAYDKASRNLLASSIVKVVGVASGANTGVTKKVLMIGDSLVNAGTITQTLLDIAATDVMGVTLVGTRGTGLNKHEGRGGWKVSDYATVGPTYYSFNVSGVTTVPQINSTTYTNNGSTFTVQEVAMSGGSGSIICSRTTGTNAPSASGTLTKSNAGVGDATITFSVSSAASGNPFWISGTLNISQYLTNNSLDTPDFVFVALGVNDVFNDTTDALALTTAETSLALLDTLIASIKAVNGTIKVALMPPTCPSSSQDSFGVSYAAGQTQWRAKRNMVIYAKALYDKYKNQEGNRIYICASNTNLDTVNNMQTEASAPINSRSTVNVTRQNNGVHPATSGYQQLGDAVWAFLKCNA